MVCNHIDTFFNEYINFASSHTKIKIYSQFTQVKCQTDPNTKLLPSVRRNEFGPNHLK